MEPRTSGGGNTRAGAPCSSQAVWLPPTPDWAEPPTSGVGCPRQQWVAGGPFQLWGSSHDSNYTLSERMERWGGLGEAQQGLCPGDGTKLGGSCCIRGHSLDWPAPPACTPQEHLLLLGALSAPGRQGTSQGRPALALVCLTAERGLFPSGAGGDDRTAQSSRGTPRLSRPFPRHWRSLSDLIRDPEDRGDLPAHNAP